MNNDLRALLHNLRINDIYDVDLYHKIIYSFFIDQRIPDYKYATNKNRKIRIRIKQDYSIRATIFFLRNNNTQITGHTVMGVFYFMNRPYIEYKPVYKHSDVATYCYIDESRNEYVIYISRANSGTDYGNSLFIVIHDTESYNNFTDNVIVEYFENYSDSEKNYFFENVIKNLIFYYPYEYKRDKFTNIFRHNYNNFLVGFSGYINLNVRDKLSNYNSFIKFEIKNDFFVISYFTQYYEHRENNKMIVQTPTATTNNVTNKQLLAQEPYNGLYITSYRRDIKSIGSYIDSNKYIYAYTEPFFKNNNYNIFSYVYTNIFDTSNNNPDNNVNYLDITNPVWYFFDTDFIRVSSYNNFSSYSNNIRNLGDKSKSGIYNYLYPYISYSV